MQPFSNINSDLDLPYLTEQQYKNLPQWLLNYPRLSSSTTVSSLSPSNTLSHPHHIPSTSTTTSTQQHYEQMNVDSSTNRLPTFSHAPRHHTNAHHHVVVPRQRDWDPFFQMIDDANSKSIVKISQSQRNAYHQMIGNCARSLNSPNSRRLRALLLAIYDLYKSSDLDARRTIRLLTQILQRYDGMNRRY